MNFNIEFFNKLATLCSLVEQAGGKNVWVAGGAVRDTLLDREVKDIDIFYEGELDDCPFEIVVKGYDQVDYSETESYLSHQMCAHPGIAYPIQLIHAENVTTCLDKFPCNISKVAVDADCSLHLSAAFMEGYMHENVEFYAGCSEEYKERIGKKYATWL